MDTVKLSGNMASFRTPLDVPIRNLKVHFSPIQAGNGDPSPENVRAISGWDEVQTVKCGKNLLKNTESTKTQNGVTWTVNNDGTITVSGTATGYSSTNVGTFYIPKNTSIITLSGVYGNTTNVTWDGIRLFDEFNNLITVAAGNKTGIQNITVDLNEYPTARIAQPVAKRITTQACSGTIKPQIELGSIATEYEPYQEQTISVSFGENGTIYGGYVDLISGELVKEWTFYELDGSENWIIATDDSYLATWVSEHSISNTDSTQVINWLQSVSDYTWQRYGKCRAQTNGAIVVGNVGDSPWEDLETFKAYLGEHHLQISYKMDTPITYQLTPQQLNAFLGYNNIWSDADSVEIEYDLAETADIIMTRKKLILNEPHVQTLTGNPATFTTDMSGLLKSCKIGFNPIQEGTGDPSPTNVRAISGQTGVTVNKTGKNLWTFDNLDEIRQGIRFQQSGSVFHISGTNTNGSIEPSNFSIYYRTLKPGTYTFSINFHNLYTKGIYFAAMLDSPFAPYGESLNFGSSQYYNVTKTITEERKIYIYAGVYGISSQWFKENIDCEILIQIENGSEPTVYEPYQGNQIPISWQSEAGTIYGGYINLINGTLVQEWVYETDNGSTWTITSVGNTYQWGHSTCASLSQNRLNEQGAGKKYWYYCTHWKTTSYDFNNAVYINENNAFRIGKDFWDAVGLTTVTNENIHNYFTEQENNGTPLYVCCQLATPITYQLTPQQIKTFKGINNIWSDTGDIEVKYWTH